MSDTEATDAVATAFRLVKKDNRSHGCLRLLIGIAMLFAGCIMLGILTMVVVRIDTAMIAIPRGTIRLGVVGSALTLGGLVVLFSGLWSTLTGR